MASLDHSQRYTAHLSCNLLVGNVKLSIKSNHIVDDEQQARNILLIQSNKINYFDDNNNYPKIKDFESMRLSI